MTLNDLQQIIGPAYNIIEAFDLVKFDNLSERDIHNLLQPLHKLEFAKNELIIFYCFSPLAHRFDDMPAETLCRLQKILVYVDIPNFFCLVITNNDNMQSELNFVCDRYAKNETPIKTRIISV